MNHWIIVPVRNNLALTKKAIESFRRQDIGNIRILVLNNGSSDGTGEWLMSQHDIFRTHHPNPGLSVAASWNKALRFVFDDAGEDHALVVNNDVELRPDTYRHLIADGGGFVTAVGVRDPKKILDLTPPDLAKKRPHPDFSCYLIRRETYHLVGPFDENFKIAYGEDADYHVRMHQAGVRAEALELPFLHHASQTITNAEDDERDRILRQAELNREYFRTKWNCAIGSAEYYASFGHGAPPDPE